MRILSTAEHEKFRRNQPGPSGKPKYYLVTDSEPVPWGKGEKNPGRGVKSTWNRMLTSSQSPLMGDGVPFVEWTGEWRFHARLIWRRGAAAKASLNRACSMRSSTRNQVTYPCAGWRCGETHWRPEPTYVEKCGDDVWVAVKFQSNLEIAGSLRNSFRASLGWCIVEVERLFGRGPLAGYRILINSECHRC